jgi:alpha-tubulin suppressor-like RCC1 family protein
LGYGNTKNVGDNENPGSVGPVKLGTGRKAVAIQAGGRHTIALLDNGRVRCWGLASDGQLGYANTTNIGDNETPDSAGPVILGGNVATS